VSVAEDESCPECAAQAALTLVLGWKTGFFLVDNDGVVDEYLPKLGLSSDQLETQLKRIFQNVNPPIRVERSIDDYQAIRDSTLVEAYQEDGVLAQAEKHLASEVQARTRLLGPEHVLTRHAKTQLASVLSALYRWDQAAELLQQVLRSNQALGATQSSCRIIQALANVHAKQGRWTEAERLLAGEIERTSKELDDVKETVDELANANRMLMEKYEGTEHMPRLEMMRDEIEDMRKASGETSQVRLRMLHQMGNIYHGQGKYNLAVDTLRKVVEGFEEHLGQQHLSTIAAMGSFAASLIKQGALVDALQVAKVINQRLRQLKGENDRETLQSEMLVAKIQFWLCHDASESINGLNTVIKKQTALLGPSHSDTLASEATLAGCYMGLQNWTSALKFQEAVVKKSEIILGSQHPITIHRRIKLGEIQISLGYVGSAIELISGGIEDFEGLFGDSHPHSISAHVSLSRALRVKGRLKDAEELGVRSLEKLQGMYGQDHALVLAAMANLADTYSASGRPERALPLLKSATEISVRTTGLDSREARYLRSRYAANARGDKEDENHQPLVSEATGHLWDQVAPFETLALMDSDLR
jgi:tetratricopeptide (TPR) repeat protein